jgi:hypothetical protein
VEPLVSIVRWKPWGSLIVIELPVTETTVPLRLGETMSIPVAVVERAAVGDEGIGVTIATCCPTARAVAVVVDPSFRYVVELVVVNVALEPSISVIVTEFDPIALTTPWA